MGKVIEKIRPRTLMARLYGRRDAGMAMAEYAIGTIVVIGFGVLVFGIMKSEAVRNIVLDLVKWIFGLITGAYS